MRVQGIVILLAALGTTQAQASSIETLQPLTGAASSIVVLGEDVSIDPSIVAATPREIGPFPSVVAVADTPDTPSIVTLGEPAPANEDLAAVPPAGSQRTTTPMVIRGGEVGSASARPSSAPAPAQPGAPLLDPDDRGTPAKRKALKRQAERLAQEAEQAAQNAETDPSTQPVPLGQ
jgi:hypothetical protein